MSQFDFRMEGTSRKGVLLIHGLTGSPAEMRFVGKGLNRNGFHVYAPTLAGHCADEAALLATTYEDWVASIRTAIREFGQDVDELYLAGICVGGMLGLMAASEEGNAVKGVTIFSPLFNYDGWNTPWHYRLSSAIPFVAHLPYLRNMAFGEAPPYGIKSDRVRAAIMGAGADAIPGTLPRFPLRALYQNFRLNKAMKKRLPSIHIPTCLIHAKEDDVCHPRNATLLQSLHGGPCEIAWLDDSYHMIHIDQERHKVAALTAEFFGASQLQAKPASAREKIAS